MPKKDQAKIEKMGFIEGERHAMTNLSARDKEDALVAIASHPIKPYLVAVIDELVRQGIYLGAVEQEGAKMMIKIMGGELQKGLAIIEKRERFRRKLDKEKSVL